MTLEDALDRITRTEHPECVSEDVYAAIVSRQQAAVEPLLNSLAQKEKRAYFRSTVEALLRLARVLVTDEAPCRKLISSLFVVTSRDGSSRETRSYAVDAVRKNPLPVFILAGAVVDLLEFKRRKDPEAILHPWVKALCEALEKDPKADLVFGAAIAQYLLDKSTEIAEASGQILCAAGANRVEPARGPVLTILQRGGYGRTLQYAVEIAGYLDGRPMIAELSEIANRPIREHDDSQIMLHLCAVLSLVRCGVWNRSFLQDAEDLPEQQWHIDTGYAILMTAGHMALRDIIEHTDPSSFGKKAAFVLEKLAASFKRPDRFPDRPRLKAALRSWIPALLVLLSLKEKIWRRAAADLLRIILEPEEFLSLVRGKSLAPPAGERWNITPDSWLSAPADVDAFRRELAPLLRDMLQDRLMEALPMLRELQGSSDSSDRLLFVQAVDLADLNPEQRAIVIDELSEMLSGLFSDPLPEVAALAAITYLEKLYHNIPKEVTLADLQRAGAAWEVFGRSLTKLNPEGLKVIAPWLTGRASASATKSTHYFSDTH